MDYIALRGEITDDPLGLGYGPLATAGNDAGLAALLNGVGSGADYLLTLAYLDKNLFLTITTPAAVRLATGLGADQTNPLGAIVTGKWNAVLEQARAADPGSQINLGLLTQLGNPVSDNVMTADEFAALTTRQGSRAEVLGGAGTVVTSDDIALALRGAA